MHYEFVCLHIIYNAQYSYTCRHIIIFFHMLTNDLIMHNMFLYVDIFFHNAHTHFYLCILIMHIYIAQHGSICCIWIHNAHSTVWFHMLAQGISGSVWSICGNMAHIARYDSICQDMIRITQNDSVFQHMKRYCIFQIHIWTCSLYCAISLYIPKLVHVLNIVPYVALWFMMRGMNNYAEI